MFISLSSLKQAFEAFDSCFVTVGINTVTEAAVYRCVKGGKEHQVMLACTILTMTEKGYNSIGCQQKEKKKEKEKNSNTKGCHSTLAVG